MCRFYFGSSTDPKVVRKLRCFDNVQLIPMDESRGIEPMMWRFLAAGDPDVDVMLSRDADARLWHRERQAVDEWLGSDSDFHIMRDNEKHTALVMGGMWGARNGVLHDMNVLVSSYVSRRGRGMDQEFLASIVFPRIKHRAWVHDPFFACRAFPCRRDPAHFVGQAYRGTGQVLEGCEYFQDYGQRDSIRSRKIDIPEYRSPFVATRDTVRIKLASNYADSESLKNRVICNWGNPPPGFELVVDGVFDYLVTFNHSEEMFTLPRSRNIVFTQEPFWSPSIRETILENSFLVFSAVETFVGPQVRREQLVFLHDTRLPESDESMERCMSDMMFADNETDRGATISMVIANHSSAGNPGDYSLYRKREALVDRILESDLSIDIYGSGWNVSDARYKGAPREKRSALKGYRYSIAVENSRESFYYSEKLVDCFANNVVPVYYGCRNVDKVFDPEAIVDIDIDDPRIIEKLHEISLRPTSPLVRQAVSLSKRKYFEHHSLYAILQRSLHHTGR
jgi:hypothetical protein